jgi:hypothetical protein
MELLNIISIEHFTKDLTKLFENDIKCIWLDENMDTIKKVFDIRGKKYDNTKYYTIYQLLITLLKNMFDEELFDYKKIKIKKNNSYYYLLNTNCLNNYTKIIKKIPDNLIFID